MPSVNDRVEPFIEALQEDSRGTNRSILFGILEREESRGEWKTYNSVFIVAGDHRQSYRKRHLVPFGEYFPVPPRVRGMDAHDEPAAQRPFTRCRRAIPAGGSQWRAARSGDLLRRCIWCRAALCAARCIHPDSTSATMPGSVIRSRRTSTCRLPGCGRSSRQSDDSLDEYGHQCFHWPPRVKSWIPAHSSKP